MTGKQRVRAALAHESVDRVPIDLGGTRQSGISMFAYARLREELGLDTRKPFKVFDVYQLLAEIEPEVLARFRPDTVALNRRCVAFGAANENWKPMRIRDVDVLVPGAFSPERDDEDWVLRKSGQIIARMPATGFYFDRYEKYPGAAHPDLSAWTPPRLTDDDLQHFDRESRRLADESDQCVIAALGPPYELFNGIGQGGFEDWMMTFASEDDYVADLYRLLVDAWIDNLIRFHQAVGDRLHVLQIADDFGTQSAPFLSVEMFREKLLPAYKRGLDWVHNHTNWKVLLHSDGAIRPLMDSIIEMGVDALNPVQTSSPGMDPGSLRAQFGNRIAFWGAGCDAQGTIVRGSPEAVRDEVTRNLDALNTLEGGHVLASIHNIQADVPARNVIALFDAANQYHRGMAHA